MAEGRDSQPVDRSAVSWLPPVRRPAAAFPASVIAKPRAWKLSNDPLFTAKVRDVVGLYLEPARAGDRVLRGSEDPNPGAGPPRPGRAHWYWTTHPPIRPGGQAKLRAHPVRADGMIEASGEVVRLWKIHGDQLKKQADMYASLIKGLVRDTLLATASWPRGWLERSHASSARIAAITARPGQGHGATIRSTSIALLPTTCGSGPGRASVGLRSPRRALLRR